MPFLVRAPRAVSHNTYVRLLFAFVLSPIGSISLSYNAIKCNIIDKMLELFQTPISATALLKHSQSIRLAVPPWELIRKSGLTHEPHAPPRPPRRAHQVSVFLSQQ